MICLTAGWRNAQQESNKIHQEQIQTPAFEMDKTLPLYKLKTNCWGADLSKTA